MLERSLAVKSSSTKPIWKSLIADSITRLDQLAKNFEIDLHQLAPVVRNFPIRITPYYLSLIKQPHDPLWRQVIPDLAELTDTVTTKDPLCEEESSPVPGLIHRYPDRVVLLVSEQCAVHCRFCMRKRRVGIAAHEDLLGAGLEYIRQTPQIHEVILSGGDPLMLDDEPLARILNEIRQCNHVRVIRIHSRMPCTLPHRITDDFTKMLRDFSPVYLNIHFNHPDEITQQSAHACNQLADAGIPIGSQTVLLKGVNDDEETMHRLMEKLLHNRVRPYYLHQLDRVQGTGHFHVPVSTGLHIMDRLRGWLSGMAVPNYMVDLPGGGGKVPLTPQYIIRQEAGCWHIKNFEGRMFSYPISSHN